MPERDFDVIFVGGGLTSALSTLALLVRRPQVRIAIVERGDSLGGNHTWCFHADDVPAAARAWVEPLIVARWPGYAVHFPRRSRRIACSRAIVRRARS